MQSTLVLNSDYTPLSLLPLSAIAWKDAIKILFLEHATALEYYDDWTVRSPSTEFPVPAVIVSKKFIKNKQGVKFSRSNLMLRDRFTCQYCGIRLSRDDLTIDHVIPRVKGGKTRWDNVVCSCYVCNSIKGHKSSIKPRTKPTKPDYYDLVSILTNMPLHIPSTKWIPYLNWKENLYTIVEPFKI